MLRFKKETEFERIERLKTLIIDDYVNSDHTQEVLISEDDLLFMLKNAEENIKGQHYQSKQDEELSTEEQKQIINDIDGEQLFGTPEKENEGFPGQMF